MVISFSKNCLGPIYIKKKMFHQITVHICATGAYFEGSKLIIYFCHLPTCQVYSKDSLFQIWKKWILTVDLTGRNGEAPNHCRLIKFIWKPSKYGRRWQIRSEEQLKTLSKWSTFSTFLFAWALHTASACVILCCSY